MHLSISLKRRGFIAGAPLKTIANALCHAFLLSGALASIAHAEVPTSSERQEMQPIEVGSARQLLLDNSLVGRLVGNAELRLHHPIPQEVSMVFDRPWEGNATAYNSIFKDGDLYRMYYRAWMLTVTPDGVDADAHPQYVCYAESRDGLHWRRRNLGLYVFQGSKANNIVFADDRLGKITFCPGNEAVFRDTNPDVSPDARYKTLRSNIEGGLYPGTQIHGGLWAFKSSDGIHWSPMSEAPVLVDHSRNAFDSQECAFWDSIHHEYRTYWRYYDPAAGGRCIRTSTSKDFLHWENRADLRYENSPQEELYENCIKPYYRAPQLLIGFPVRYVERGWSDSMRDLPDPVNRVWRSGHLPITAKMRQTAASRGIHDEMDNGRGATTVHERYGTALTESLLMASRDGVTFKRWNEAFIRPGIERTGTWNYGQLYVGWQLIETPSALEGAPNEISLFASEHYWIGKEASLLRRYTLRLDGFVSAQAPLSGGEFISKSIRFRGGKLLLNFSTSAAGSIRVELQNPDGKPIPGFSLDECPPIFGDTIDRVVTWNGGSDVGSLAGRTVRLRFELKDADLYAFQFSDKSPMRAPSVSGN